MITPRHALLPCVLLAASAIAVAQQTPPLQKYLADFDVFIAILTETHPDPYSGFGGRVEFHRAKQKLRAELTTVTTDERFVAALNTFLAPLGDGHTVVNQPGDETAGQRADVPAGRLPVQLKAASDGLFVQNSTEALKDLIGLRVDAIQNVPVGKLLDEVARQYPTENASDTSFHLMRAVADREGANRLLGKTETLTFTLSSPGGRVTKEVAFQPQVTWRPEQRANRPDNALLSWAMVGTQKDIGYLAWNSIASREMVEEVRLHSPRYLEMNLDAIYNGVLGRQRTGDPAVDLQGIPSLYEQFALLMGEMRARGSRHLVVDLRHNGGGTTPLVLPLVYVLHGDKFLKQTPEGEYIKKLSPLYLKKIGQSLEQFNARARTSYQMGDYVFGNILGRSGEQSIEERKREYESGYFNLGSEHIKKALASVPADVDVTVLTSPATFSAAYHFAYLLREVGGARILGVASRQAGNTFMETTPFELPNTKIRGSISNAQQIFFKHDPALGKLLRPDVEMRWDDFREYGFNPDAELLKAIAVIERGASR